MQYIFIALSFIGACVFVAGLGWGKWIRKTLGNWKVCKILYENPVSSIIIGFSMVFLFGWLPLPIPFKMDIGLYLSFLLGFLPFIPKIQRRKFRERLFKKAITAKECNPPRLSLEKKTD